jgi:lipoyl(octanoyl) transferase
MKKLKLIDLGLRDYKETWDFQEKLFNETIHNKIKNWQLAIPEQEEIQSYLILVEHPHVYTLGKSGNEHNLLIQEGLLKSIGASFYKIDRGGDITYHGPGQIVGYPILDLESTGMSIKEYIHTLEEVIIKTIGNFGLFGGRLEGAIGVWLDVNTSKPRKICAIGVKASRYITMHGFALNVNTDLKYFGYINPCGFTDKGVTSLQKELGHEVDMEEVKTTLIAYFSELFS